MSATRDAVLMLGGTGTLGSRTARILRSLHPDLPLAIAARDQERARSFARSLGNAEAIAVDLGRPDLGLPDHRTFSMVVPTVRDLAFNSLRFAQSRRIPYIALSDAAFELAPVVAMFAHRPTAAPLLLLGHSHGGIPSIVAGVLARQFKEVASIAIGLVFDPDDPFGPGSQARRPLSGLRTPARSGHQIETRPISNRGLPQLARQHARDDRAGCRHGCAPAGAAVLRSGDARTSPLPARARMPHRTARCRGSAGFARNGAS